MTEQRATSDSSQKAAPACCESTTLQTCCGAETKPGCCGPDEAPKVCGCGASLTERLSQD